MEKLLQNVYENKKLSAFLKWVGHISVFGSLIGFCLISYGAFSLSVGSLIKALIIMGVPFVLVTLLRRVIDLKRPYGVYGFYEEPPKDKKGRSFPSRHAFSAFVIGTTAVFLYPLVGGVLLLFGILLSVCRVLLGIHFIRDVLCGALIGVASALIGVLILAPF